MTYRSLRNTKREQQRTRVRLCWTAILPILLGVTRPSGIVSGFQPGVVVLLDRGSKNVEDKPVIEWRTCRSFFGALLCIVLSSCETINGFACGSGRQRAVQEMVYFGTNTPSGRVTPEEWTRFLSDMVTPRFPEGLSVWKVSGQWRAASGAIVNEPTYVLSLVHPDNAVTNKAIQDILASYKTRYQQEAVLRVTSSVCASL